MNNKEQDKESSFRKYLSSFFTTTSTNYYNTATWGISAMTAPSSASMPLTAGIYAHVWDSWDEEFKERNKHLEAIIIPSPIANLDEEEFLIE